MILNAVVFGRWRRSPSTTAERRFGGSTRNPIVVRIFGMKEVGVKMNEIFVGIGV